MKITNIEWDYEIDSDDANENVDLPTEVQVPEGLELDEDEIEDYLSDEYGFCVYSFNVDYEKKKYRVYGEAKDVYYIDVYANSEEEAIQIADEEGNIDKWEFDSYNSTGVNITEVEADEEYFK